MFQFLGIMLVICIVVVQDRMNTAKNKEYLQQKYKKAELIGDADAALWYAERLSKIK